MRQSLLCVDALPALFEKVLKVSVFYNPAACEIARNLAAFMILVATIGSPFLTAFS